MADEERMLLSSPLGSLLLSADASGLTCVRLVGDVFAVRETIPENPFLREAAMQIRAYFAGTLRRFDVPLHPAGTPFQKRVWAALREIPYGETRSYKDIARAVGSPRAFRAVGMANHRNPLLLVTPCHRVIAADGALRGFACGLECKSFLLRFESGNLLKK